MIVKGRCRGNGAQLANYLLNTKDNIRADFLSAQGTYSNDPRRALLEMSLTSELTNRTKDGLYHCQLSPRADEAAEMTWEQKKRSVEIMAEQMGLEGHKWALFEHEKEDGRMHMHLVFERWNHDTRRMWKDDRNYEKHQIAARQMEIEFGWQLTHENKRTLDKDVQEHLTDLWLESETPAGFVAAMEKAGFEVTQGIDKRPYQIVDQFGRERDLTRQLLGIGQRDVSQYLNSIRSELRPTTEASYDRRQRYERENPVQEHSENQRDLSDSQDLAQAMIDKVKQQDKEVEQGDQLGKMEGYSFKFEQILSDPPSLPRQPDEKIQSENMRDLSESQDLAAAMIDYQQKRTTDRQTTLQEAKNDATEQTRPANDNQPTRYFNPVTGHEMTAEQYRKMQEILEQAAQRERERKGRSRDGLEY